MRLSSGGVDVLRGAAVKDNRGVRSGHGRARPPEQLKSYAEVLAQYQLSQEAKFANGQFLDRGRAERRYIVATSFVMIGKEANRVGDSGEADAIASPITAFAQ